MSVLDDMERAGAFAPATAAPSPLDDMERAGAFEAAPTSRLDEMERLGAFGGTPQLTDEEQLQARTYGVEQRFAQRSAVAAGLTGGDPVAWRRNPLLQSIAEQAPTTPEAFEAARTAEIGRGNYPAAGVLSHPEAIDNAALSRAAAPQQNLYDPRGTLQPEQRSQGPQQLFPVRPEQNPFTPEAVADDSARRVGPDGGPIRGVYEYGKAAAGRILEDPGQAAENFGRNALMTVLGPVQLARMAGETAWGVATGDKSPREAAMAFARGGADVYHTIVDELSKDRYFFDNPLDAAALLAGGAGAVTAGLARTGAIGSRVGGAVGRVARVAQLASNPVEWVKGVGRGVGYVAGQINPALVRPFKSFDDLFGAEIQTPDGAKRKLVDVIRDRDAALAWEIEQAKRSGGGIPDALAAQVEETLRGLGEQFYVRVPGRAAGGPSSPVGEGEIPLTATRGSSTYPLDTSDVGPAVPRQGRSIGQAQADAAASERNIIQQQRQARRLDAARQRKIRAGIVARSEAAGRTLSEAELSHGILRDLRGTHPEHLSEALDVLDETPLSEAHRQRIRDAADEVAIHQLDIDEIHAMREEGWFEGRAADARAHLAGLREQQKAARVRYVAAVDEAMAQTRAVRREVTAAQRKAEEELAALKRPPPTVEARTPSVRRVRRDPDITDSFTRIEPTTGLPRHARGQDVAEEFGEDVDVMRRSMATDGRGTALWEMAERYRAGERIEYVPAEHIGRARTLQALEELTPEELARIQTSEAASVLDDLRNLAEPERAYLRWVNDALSDDALKTAVGTYAARLPSGDVPVHQIGSVGQLASDIRTRFLNAGAAAVTEGLLDAQVFAVHLHDYFPDMYKKFEQAFPDYIRGAVTGSSRVIRGDRFRHAYDKWVRSLDDRTARGLIRDPKYVTARGLAQIQSDVVNARFFNELSNSKWTDGGALAAEGKRAPDWKQIPKNKKYGQLSEKWVPPELHRYATALVEVPNMAWRAVSGLMGAWKFGMTVLNPATQVRNLVGNVLMADMAGMNPLTHSRMLYGSYREVWRGQGRWYDDAMKDGLFGTDFVSAELRRELRGHALKDPKWVANGDAVGMAVDQANAIRKVWDGMYAAGSKSRAVLRKYVADPASFVYQMQENAFKLNRYRQIRQFQAEFKSNGGRLTRDMQKAFGSRQEALQFINAVDDRAARRAAVKSANEWFFDYRDVPIAVEWLRKGWQPFVTYQFKAIPRVFKWMSEHPWKAMYYRQMFETMNVYSEYLSGDAPDEAERLDREMARQGLPGYSRLGAVYTGKTTFDTPDGESAPVHSFADLQYFTPLGGLVRREEGTKGSRIPFWAMPTHPVITGIIGPQIFQRMGLSPTEGDLRDEDVNEESLRNLVPGYRQATKAVAAYKGDADRRVGGERRIRHPGETALDLGLGHRQQFVPVGGGEVKMGFSVQREVRDVRNMLSRDLRSAQSEEQKEALRLEAQTKINRIIQNREELMREAERRAR